MSDITVNEVKVHRKPCTIQGCGKPSIPGLFSGAGKCQYHWNVGVWGKEWADNVEQRKSVSKTKGLK